MNGSTFDMFQFFISNFSILFAALSSGSLEAMRVMLVAGAAQ